MLSSHFSGSSDIYSTLLMIERFSFFVHNVRLTKKVSEIFCQVSEVTCSLQA